MEVLLLVFKHVKNVHTLLYVADSTPKSCHCWSLVAGVKTTALLHCLKDSWTMSRASNGAEKYLLLDLYCVGAESGNDKLENTIKLLTVKAPRILRTMAY